MGRKVRIEYKKAVKDNFGGTTDFNSTKDCYTRPNNFYMATYNKESIAVESK